MEEWLSEQEADADHDRSLGLTVSDADGDHVGGEADRCDDSDIVADWLLVRTLLTSESDTDDVRDGLPVNDGLRVSD